MDYDEFSADLSACGGPRFHLLEEAEDALRALGLSRIQYRQLGKGSFSMDLAAVQTSAGIVLSHTFERRFFSPLHTVDGMVTLLMGSTAGADAFASGEIISNEKLLVQTPGAQVDMITPDLARSDALAVPEKRFYSLLHTICPGDSWIRPGEFLAAPGDLESLDRLRHAVRHIAKHPESDPRHERQANLIAEVIAWVGDSVGRGRSDGFPVNGARARIARRARDYMEDHYAGPLRLEDVCRETGVGLRTMQRAFAEYFQMSPYRYVRIMRLDRARRDLLAGNPKSHSVTAIASLHGFNHLSRFAKDYRKTFAEKPSETLARRS